MPSKKRKLTADEVREVLSLTRKDITASKLRDYFAGSIGEEPRFNTFDTFTLPINKLYNKESIETTIGRYIINLFCYPTKYLEKYGYSNAVLTKGAFEKIDDAIAEMLLNDEINSQEYTEYLNHTEWISMNTAYYLNPTMSYGFNKPIPEVMKRRDELFDQYKEEIERGDTNASDKIEKELLALSKQKIKEIGDESYEYYESGNASFDQIRSTQRASAA